MTDREVSKLNRRDLLELLLETQTENETLQKDCEDLKKQADALRDALRQAEDSLRKAKGASASADWQAAADLLDTLRANLGRCVGMAANMIGEKKRIIVFCDGPKQTVMVNPRITSGSGEYETEEGCLSLPGVRKTKRYRKITVKYQDQAFRGRTGTFEGYTAQIIQHETDHCDGILI